MNLSVEAQAREAQKAYLAMLDRFVSIWRGKVVEVRSRTYDRLDRGVVIGHDGPHYGMTRASHLAVIGWGSVLIMESPGITSYLGLANIASIREVDDYCPYGCVDGVREWSEDFEPEYERICPVHRSAAYQAAVDEYHKPEDQQDRQLLASLTGIG